MPFQSSIGFRLVCRYNIRGDIQSFDRDVRVTSLWAHCLHHLADLVFDNGLDDAPPVSLSFTQRFREMKRLLGGDLARQGWFVGIYHRLNPHRSGLGERLAQYRLDLSWLGNRVGGRAARSGKGREVDRLQLDTELR